MKEDGESSTTYTFPCKRWLAKDEDDGSVVRELIPQKVVEESVTEDGEVETKEINQETLERESCFGRFPPYFSTQKVLADFLHAHIFAK